MVRDVGVAEELAQDALVAALEQWPREGVPDNPAAWLMQAAKHRALDLLRRRKLHASKEDEIGREIDAQHAMAAADFADAVAPVSHCAMRATAGGSAATSSPPASAATRRSTSPGTGSAPAPPCS